MTFLLVTGSRSLCEFQEAEGEVRSIVQRLINQGVTYLFVGDAKGPDKWAASIAKGMGISYRVYEGYSGFVWRHERSVDQQAALSRRAYDWSSRSPGFLIAPERMKPLLRNAVMVNDFVKAAKSAGARMIAHAFVDPLSKTSGTLHTIGLASRVGIKVFKHKWGDV